MIRVLATDGMDASAAEKLQYLGYEVVQEFYEPEALKAAVKECDVMVVRSATKVTKEIIAAAAEAGRLKLVIRGGVGIDNIDKDAAEAVGIKVTNTPAASSASVAELALAHMFSLARFIGIANATMRAGEWNKKKYVGIELNGKTLGLIGFGRIARELAKKGNALGMNVIYNDIMGQAEGVDYAKFVEHNALLAQADFLSLHVPGLGAQSHLIGADEIAKMKDGAYIINTSRGEHIDIDALLAALDSGKLAGAALDVFEQEPVKDARVLSNAKISMTPHIGAATNEAQERIGSEIVSIITSAFPDNK